MDIIISNWHYYVEGQQFSTEEFYEVLKKDFLRHKIPKSWIGEHSILEGNVFSPRRRYLWVRQHEQVFEICAAPFGTGFFFSWWLVRRLGCLPDLFRMVPFIGNWLVRIFFQTTYYKMDTAMMFREAVRKCVTRVVNQFLDVSGSKQLTESEEKPILHDVFKR